jgi:Arc/MetJ family transcription regulator
MCKEKPMPTNLAIDDDLIAQVQKIGGHKTKKAAVNEALAEYLRHRRQLALLDDFGTVDYDSTYDSKEARR